MFSKLFRTLGIIFVAYWLFLCIYIGFTQFFSYIWLVLGVLLIFLGNMGKILKRVIIIIMLLSLIGGSIVEVPILKGTLNEPAENASYVIVLGAKVNGNEPSKLLKGRLDAAVSYVKANNLCKVIVTGGKGSDEETCESYVMRDYLISRGIDRNIIETEDKSKNTKENLMFSREIIGRSDAKTVIITSDFHMHRALKLAKELNYKNVSGKCAKTELMLIPNYYVREIFAVIKSVII